MMNDKTDNPEMIKVYKRLIRLLKKHECMRVDAEYLKQDIDSTYEEINHICNRLESIEYHQKEEEHQCSHCNRDCKDEKDNVEHWTSNNKRNTYKRW